MGANPGGTGRQGDMSTHDFEDGGHNIKCPPPPPTNFVITQGPSPSELISLISMVNPTNTLFQNIEINDRLVYVKYYIFDRSLRSKSSG